MGNNQFLIAAARPPNHRPAQPPRLLTYLVSFLVRPSVAHLWFPVSFCDNGVHLGV
jgi:hypothetical protein